MWKFSFVFSESERATWPFFYFLTDALMVFRPWLQRFKGKQRASSPHPSQVVQGWMGNVISLARLGSASQLDIRRKPVQGDIWEEPRLTSKWRAHPLCTTTDLPSICFTAVEFQWLVRLSPSGNSTFWLRSKRCKLALANQTPYTVPVHPQGLTGLYSDTSAFTWSWSPFAAIQSSFTCSPSNHAFVVVDFSFLRCYD